MQTKNENLNKASKGKNDEFYTQLIDIKKELDHYFHHFRNKVVYCNCDDPETSNFYTYFSQNFEKLGLTKLITTSYSDPDEPNHVKKASKHAISLLYSGRSGRIVKTFLNGTGDFRSAECIAILKEADIVVTNPPFSLFKEYVTLLMEHKKQFLILGSQSAIIYKGIFQYIKENRLWLGIDNGGTKWFEVPNGYTITTSSRKKIENGKQYFSMGSIMWYTNLDTKKRHQNLMLRERYDPDAYPKYDNYDAIEVAKYTKIPMDYAGVMGVPITFLDKYDPDQFEIVGCNRGIGQDPKGIYGRSTYLNGKETFKRLFIRNKKITI